MLGLKVVAVAPAGGYDLMIDDLLGPVLAQQNELRMEDTGGAVGEDAGGACRSRSEAVAGIFRTAAGTVRFGMRLVRSHPGIAQRPGADLGDGQRRIGSGAGRGSALETRAGVSRFAVGAEPVASGIRKLHAADRPDCCHGPEILHLEFPDVDGRAVPFLLSMDFRDPAEESGRRPPVDRSPARPPRFRAGKGDILPVLLVCNRRGKPPQASESPIFFRTSAASMIATTHGQVPPYPRLHPS